VNDKTLEALTEFAEATPDRFFSVDYSGCTKRWTVNVFLGAGYTCPGAKVIERRDRWLEVHGSTIEAALMLAAERLQSVRALAVAP
jgi:hypothetical protein